MIRPIGTYTTNATNKNTTGRKIVSVEAIFIPSEDKYIKTVFSKDKYNSIKN